MTVYVTEALLYDNIHDKYKIKIYDAHLLQVVKTTKSPYKQAYYLSK